MTALFVGELNPYGGDPRYALYPEPPTSAGGRLCRKVLGLEPREYLRRYDRANLCVGRWSARAARAEAQCLLTERRPEVVVMLGRRVAAAFGVGLEAFEVLTDGLPPRRRVYVALPHPSGLCRVWNEPGAFERARVLLREVGALG